MAVSDYYDHTTYPSQGAVGSSSAARAEFKAIEDGISAKLPDLAGNGGKITAINAGATALEAIVTTGTGSGVRATTPTLVTPVLGVATVTSVNKVAITAPDTAATLTLAEGSTLATAGAFSQTLTATAATNVTLPTTGTLATLAGAETLTNKTLTSPDIAGTPTIALIDAKGDLLVGTGDNVIARKAVGGEGYTLMPVSGTTDGLAYLPPQSGFSLLNGYLSWTVASNTLTVAIKTWAGTDPSATDPVFIAFRNADPAIGSLILRKLTAANSITINDTALLGAVNDVPFRIWCVAFDDGGTVRLAVINCRALGGTTGTSIYSLAGFGVASATLEDDASDLGHVFYSAGASVTAKSYATLGYGVWEAGLATAGTWSAAPTRAQLFGNGVPLPGHVIQTQRSDTGAVATGTTIIPADDTIPQITEGDKYMEQAITPNSAANILDVKHQGWYASNIATTGHSAAIFRDAVADALVATLFPKADVVDARGMATLNCRRLAASTAATTFTVRAGPPDAATTTFNGSGGGRNFGGVANSFLQVDEVMA